jgi:hypothetical protein
VDEELSATIAWSDEAEATVFIPRSERAGSGHGEA